MRRDPGGLKILIADDDAFSSLVLRKMLEAMGHEVVCVPDGAQAWGLLRRGDFRVVISDWAMPGMDGLELCRRVRTQGDGPLYTYLILLTARADSKDRAEGYEAGFDDFLTKPLDRSELVARFGVARRIIAMQEDLHNRTLELERMHAEVQRQCALLAEVATSDGLTGLKNRRHFRESLEPSISFSGRNNLPLSVVMLDVDHFKDYNDTFGHPAGDHALSELGRLLGENARDHDVVARYGGEEFAILLPATDGAGARQFCERLRTLIESHPWPLRPITASLGIATSSVGASTATQLIDEADRALYFSKHRGRNCVSHFEASFQTVP